MFLFFYILGFLITIGMFLMCTKLMIHDSYISSKNNKPVKYKRWQWIIIVLCALTPVLNCCMIMFLFPVYFEYRFKSEVKEKFNKTLFKRFLNYLNEEV